MSPSEGRTDECPRCSRTLLQAPVPIGTQMVHVCGYEFTYGIPSAPENADQCATPDCERLAERGGTKCCLTCIETIPDVHLAWCRKRNGEFEAPPEKAEIKEKT